MLSRPLHDRIVVDGLVAGVVATSEIPSNLLAVVWSSSLGARYRQSPEEMCHGWTLRRA